LHRGLASPGRSRVHLADRLVRDRRSDRSAAVPTGAGFLAGVDEYRRRVADAMHRRADRWLADWESERFGPTEIPDE